MTNPSIHTAEPARHIDLADPVQAARLALACLDLTSLGDADTEADVDRLCERAQTRHGPVAAVCVWPRFAAAARRSLPSHIAVAAVANFPEGDADPTRAVREVRSIVEAGAQEADVVLPFDRLLHGDETAVTRWLEAVRAACPGLVLKVILETGVLSRPELIARAAWLSLEAGADFLKTSTGKRPVGATPEAARLLLSAIAARPSTRRPLGFKASGGVRSIADAALYLGLVRDALGEAALVPARVRIGASGLLDVIDTALSGGAGPVGSASAY